MTKSGLESDNYEGNSESSADNNTILQFNLLEVSDEPPTKVLEVLKVLEREKQLSRKWPGSDIWACPNCNITGDKWCMLEHSCKTNKMK